MRKYIHPQCRLWETYQWHTHTHKQIISFVTNVTRPSLHVGTLKTHTFKIHKKIQTVDDPFDWSTYVYFFSQSGVWCHIRVHIERKPSRSPKYGIIFTLRVDFGRHRKDTHTSKVNTYICNQCDKTFFTFWDFRTHTINIHKKITHEMSLVSLRVTVEYI